MTMLFPIGTMGTNLNYGVIDGVSYYLRCKTW